MTFDEPIPFQEAIDKAVERVLMPTAKSSRELRELGRSVLDRSVFSARTSNATYVQKTEDVVVRLLTPQTESGQRVSFAQMREDLGRLLQELDYDPQRGFPGDDALGIPAAEPGSLRDLGSEVRLNLMLDTQVRQMLGAGYRMRGMEADRLDQFPCWELVRLYPRRVERLDWERRWELAGGQFYDGRMIARKDAEVWNQLGSSELFDDGLDNPYPPFAFNSGMGVEEIDRDEAVALGVISEDEELDPLPTELNDSLAAQAKNFSPELLDELIRELGDEAKRLENRLADEAALLNDGTHEGALKGWETRRGGPAAEKQVKAGRALRAHATVRGAMHVKKLGSIDFEWGRPGTAKLNEQGASHADGYGISHILAKRGEAAVRKLPEILAKGRVLPHSTNAARRMVKYDGWTAIVEKRGKANSYVVTNIDDDIKNGRLPRRAIGLGRRWEPGCGPCPTHTALLFGKSGMGASNGSTIGQTQAKIKAILDLLPEEAAA